MRNQFDLVLKEVKPDIVHAHNIFAAKLAIEAGLPMIYDDHEYWSMWMKAELEGWIKDLIVNVGKSKAILTQRYGAYLWSRWEERILSDVPSIAVCEATAREHEQRGSAAYVIPNMLNDFEARSMPTVQPSSSLSTAIIGNDFSAPMKIRDSREALTLFSNRELGRLTIIGDPGIKSRDNVESLGSLGHMDMLAELSRHQVGLIPWKPHWFHRYCNPNKAYEYMHAGLIPLIPCTLQPVIDDTTDYARTFSDYDELRQILLGLSGVPGDEMLRLRVSIQEYARRQLLWNRFEDRIFEAYSRA